MRGNLVSRGEAICLGSTNETTYRGEKSSRNHDGVCRDRNVDPPDPIDHLAEKHLARDFQPAPILDHRPLTVLPQHQQVPLSVALQECVLGEMGHGGGPCGLIMACHLLQRVADTILPGPVLDNRDALHEVRDGDRVSHHRKVNRSGRHAIARTFDQTRPGCVVLKEVDDDLRHAISSSRLSLAHVRRTVLTRAATSFPSTTPRHRQDPLTASSVRTLSLLSSSTSKTMMRPRIESSRSLSR